MKSKPISLLDATKEELFRSIRELQAAKDNFDNAIPEFFEVANIELTIAQQRVDALILKCKLLAAD